MGAAAGDQWELMEYLLHVCGRRSSQTPAPLFGTEKGLRTYLVLARKGVGSARAR